MRTKDGKQTPEYRAWANMLSRCYNTNLPYRSYYGGRGIGVCDRWRYSFENFLADMGPRPEGMTLDRWPDNNGDYGPDNCRWATRQQQSNNLRSNIVVELGCLIGTLPEWCRALKISVKAVDARLRLGWTFYEALFTPIVPGANQSLRPERARMPRSS